ncbi:MAG: MoxR family ATPase [Ruminococcus sp.]|jgi:MoxR-like ATPase|nr:MoxR family ATPase [Ruminococcus sp.]
MNEKIKLLTENIEKVIAGKHTAVTQIIMALITGGHVLIEDVPGVGKTQLAAALSKSVGGQFNRLQLTPDVMPSDIVGFSIPDKETGALLYKPGAAVCNFLLADEINRASPKTQSALLEVMEEHQISIDGVTHPLPRLHMVIATQNPVETFGTYHLPEAQMDRFAVKLTLGYPDPSAEGEILGRNEFSNPIYGIGAVLSIDDVLTIQEEVKKVRSTELLNEYIIALAGNSRNSDLIKLGISPRGSIMLHRLSKAKAYIEGRDFVTPDDVKGAAVITLSHRITLSPKGKSVLGTTANAVEKLLSETVVPI